MLILLHDSLMSLEPQTSTSVFIHEWDSVTSALPLAWVAACSPSAMTRGSVHVIAVCLPARRRFQLEITEVNRLSSWLLAILYCDNCFHGRNRMLLLWPCAAFLVCSCTPDLGL